MKFSTIASLIFTYFLFVSVSLACLDSDNINIENTANHNDGTSTSDIEICVNTTKNSVKRIQFTLFYEALSGVDSIIFMFDPPGHNMGVGTFCHTFGGVNHLVGSNVDYRVVGYSSVNGNGGACGVILTHNNPTIDVLPIEIINFKFEEEHLVAFEINKSPEDTISNICLLGSEDGVSYESYSCHSSIEGIGQFDVVPFDFVYFQLAVSDINGEVVYSNVIHNEVEVTSFTLSHTLIEESFSIYFNNHDIVQNDKHLVVTNSFGNIVYADYVTSTSVTVPMSNLNKGTYYVAYEGYSATVVKL